MERSRRRAGEGGAETQSGISSCNTNQRRLSWGNPIVGLRFDSSSTSFRSALRARLRLTRCVSAECGRLLNHMVGEVPRPAKLNIEWYADRLQAPPAFRLLGSVHHSCAFQMDTVQRERTRDVSDPQGKVLDLVFGRWRSQILYAGVKLGIFDALHSGLKTATAIAHELELDSALAYRLLRALGSLELVREGKDRTFSLTEAGDLLRSDHPHTLRGVTLLEEGCEHYALWKHLPAMVHDGKQNAFVREFGRMAFDHAVHDEGYAQVFDDAMSSYSQTQAEWVLDALGTYDFSKISHLCDMGGGHGYMLCRMLAKYPHLEGTVLERAEVIADSSRYWAGKLGLGTRCQYVAGDMFKAAPTADAYMMKLILHDWNDEECIQILENQRDAATSGARVFIIEHVIPDPDTPHFAKLFDIHMMCWGTGRERTREEYAALLGKAGWKYVTTWVPSSRAIGIIEGAKV